MTRAREYWAWVMAAVGLALCAAALSACGENLTHPGEAPDAAVLSCLPDLDGRIEADELSAALGQAATYLVSPEGSTRSVDLVGSVDGGGRRVWDWSAPDGSDTSVELAVSPVAGAWFASRFPAGQFAAPVDAAGTLLGVYRQDDEALWLLGLVSSEPDPPEGATLLVYEVAVAALRFPLVDGLTWTEVGEIPVGLGTLRGLPYSGRDIYEVRVDGSGRMELPDFAFTQALRVRTTVTVEPTAGAAITRRQAAFIFECFGEVARATSANGESQDDFTTAAEVRRRSI